MNGYIKRHITHFQSGTMGKIYDNVTLEEPVEIILYDGNETYNVSVIMRTPVDDFALAAGFLFTEGIVKPQDLEGIKYSESAGISEKNNIVTISVKSFDRQLIGNRNFYVNSSCGVCGKTNINDIYLKAGHLIGHGNPIDCRQLLKLPEIMRAKQSIFQNTGGCACCSNNGLFRKYTVHGRGHRQAQCSRQGNRKNASQGNSKKS